MNRDGAFCGPFWAFKESENLNLRKSHFFSRFPSCFPMKLKLTAAISRVPQLFGRSRLGFWMPLGSPFKNTSKLKKCQNGGKSRFLVGHPVGFVCKIETSGGHNSSTPWSWRLQSGFLVAPWVPLNKSIFS
jgi:hypothetical protein